MHGDEFEDDTDEDGPVRPLLPPDDRIWRHPSELAALTASPVARPYAGRTAWPVPARAGILAAGLTGALLATGLVLLGTQLMVAVQQQQLAGHTRTSSGSVGRPDAPALATKSTDKPTITTLATMRPEQPTPQTGPQPAAQPGTQQITRQVADVVVKVSAASVDVTAMTPHGAVAGTGLVFSGDGYLVTALALVSGATSLSVSAPGLGRRSASVVGTDSRTGIAVLHCQGADLLAVPFTTSAIEASEAPPDAVQPNDSLWAVIEGPNGADVASGQAEAVDMTLAARSTTGVLTPAFFDAIQASVVPTKASLGSALIDSKGRLVGIAVGSSQAGTTAVTPFWLAFGAATEIMLRGSVEPGWLGISGVNDGDGVRVLGVLPRSSAAAAGILPGDVIMAVDGSPTIDMGSLEAHVYCLAPGTTARLSIKRHGRKINDKVTMERAPAA